MTQELAESIKDLAKDTINALSIIVKSVARECPKCKGNGQLKLTKQIRDSVKTLPEVEIGACPQCNGTGKISQQEMVRQAKESIAKKERGKYRLVYKKDRRTIVAEPRGWEWKPEVRERCLWGEAVLLVTDINDYKLSVSGVEIIEEVNVNQVIPILSWQEIKRVLEGMGYIVKVRDQKDFGRECRYNCGIYSDKLGVGTSAPTQQEAVMLTVDRLAKELK